MGHVERRCRVRANTSFSKHAENKNPMQAFMGGGISDISPFPMQPPPPILKRSSSLRRQFSRGCNGRVARIPSMNSVPFAVSWIQTIYFIVIQSNNSIQTEAKSSNLVKGKMNKYFTMQLL